MSRTLAELLDAPELGFRARVQQLEQASGLPAADVHLTAQLLQGSQQKLRALRLDAHDTTGKELYSALNQQFLQDNQALVRALAKEQRLQGDAHEVMSIVKVAASHLPLPTNSLAIKPAAAKKMLKKVAPKLTMKLLGYRSLDSMVKHEPPAALLVAAELLEPASWQRQYAKALASLKITDFETRPLTISYLSQDRWRTFAEHPSIKRKHHVIGAPLSAQLLLLPYGDEAPAAAVLSSLILVVTAINHLAAASSYLKLHQMRPDFSEAIATLQSNRSQPILQLLTEPISWQLVQRYYHRFQDVYRHELFEPYLQPEDFSWLGIDVALMHLAPNLSFWQDTASLGQLHNGETVSYNLHDVALNAINSLPYQQRSTQHFKQSLWHELLLRYLQPANVEAALLKHMQPAMAEVIS